MEHSPRIVPITEETALMHILHDVFEAQCGSAYHHALEALGVTGASELMDFEKEDFETISWQTMTSSGASLTCFLKPIEVKNLVLVQKWYIEQGQPQDCYQALRLWFELDHKKFIMYRIKKATKKGTLASLVGPVFAATPFMSCSSPRKHQGDDDSSFLYSGFRWTSGPTSIGQVSPDIEPKPHALPSEALTLVNLIGRDELSHSMHGA